MMSQSLPYPISGLLWQADVFARGMVTRRAASMATRFTAFSADSHRQNQPCRDESACDGVGFVQHIATSSRSMICACAVGDRHMTESAATIRAMIAYFIIYLIA